MATDITVPLAAIALVGSILALVVTPLFKLLQENTTATTALVKETEKGNREAKQRNGHLGDQNIQITKLITGQNQDVAAIKESNARNAATNKRVEEILSKSAFIAAQDRDVLTSMNQIVEHQEVKEQTITHVKGK